jgi:hypothetical protein
MIRLLDFTQFYKIFSSVGRSTLALPPTRPHSGTRVAHNRQRWQEEPMRDWLLLLAPIVLVIYFLAYPDQFSAFVYWASHRL